EPRAIQRAQQRKEHRLGKLLVKAELVDLVVPGQTVAQQREDARHAPVPDVRCVVGRRGRLDHRYPSTAARTRRIRSRIFCSAALTASGASGPYPAPRMKSSNAAAVGRGSKPTSSIRRVVSTTRPCTNRSSWSREKSSAPQLFVKPATADRPGSTTASPI